MIISSLKSSFFSAGVAFAHITNIKDFLPCSVKNLDVGLNYLGFKLKPTKYSHDDWIWLLARIKYKIYSWGYKYLSLGGRVCLINSFLCGIPVFWCSLFLMPASILMEMCKLFFKFLWGGSVEVFGKYHLADWETLSLPKLAGGWGIKNLEWFNISLLLKTMWSGARSDGLWGLVLRKIYLGNLSIIGWIRNDKYKNSHGYAIWNKFTKYFEWIGQYLAWYIGDGRQVRVGVDPFVDGDDKF
jgi:hypothetical protein